MESIKQKIENGLYLFVEEQVLLMQSNEPEALELICKYVNNYKLSKKGEIALMQRGDADLIIFYLKNYYYLHEQAVSALFTMPKWKTKAHQASGVRIFKNLTQSRLLSDAAEVALIKAGNRAMIAALIQQGDLFTEGQVALLKSGDEELIKFQILKHGLKEAAQLELVKLGKTDWVLFYLERHSLCDQAWQYWKVLHF